jgi:hypothetical protein
LQLSEPGVGNERAGILHHHGAGVRHRSGIIGCLVRGVSTVGVDIQANPVPHGRTDLSHAGDVDLEALAAFDLERPKAVTGHHGGRLGSHRVRRLPRERPRELDPTRSSPTPPQGLAVAGGMEIPTGVVDQRLRRLVLGNAVEQRAHLDRIIQIHFPQQRQKNLSIVVTSLRAVTPHQVGFTVISATPANPVSLCRRRSTNGAASSTMSLHRTGHS